MEITRNMNFAGVPWPGVQREYSKNEKDRGFLWQYLELLLV